MAELGALEQAGATAVAAEDVEATAIGRLGPDRVRAALDQLNDRERSLLVLRYWEDLSTEAVARSLAMTEGAVRVALLRARRSLAAALGRSELGDREVGDAV